MASKNLPPEILVLTSLNPIERDGVLHSPNLNSRLLEYGAHEGAMWGALYDSENDSLAERAIAKRLADYNLLKIAAELQNNRSEKLSLVRQFNHACEEMYGKIDVDEVAKLASEEIDLLNFPKSSFALFVYERLAKTAETRETASSSETDLSEFKSALFDKFSNFVEIVGALPEGPYDSPTVRKVFLDIMAAQSVNDPAWSEWSVIASKDKKTLSVNASQKKVDVPDGRGLVESKEQLLGLVMHELGVHVQRSISGYNLNDEMLAKGLPGYIDFEEGVGILSEYLSTGIIPDKAKDRYIDIALAKGSVDGLTLSRLQLIELGTAREAARASMKGSIVSYEDKEAVSVHVNRIFRGGNGLPIIAEDGSIVTQAVFSKDIVYYQGFAKVRNFIANQQKAGSSPKQILDYLLAGKFDASSEEDVAYLKDKHAISV